MMKQQHLGNISVSHGALQQNFHQIFGGFPEFIVSAPGRVNLIGEHTDYNDGYVFPVAIDKYLHIAARKRADNQVKLYARDINEHCQFELVRLDDGSSSIQNADTRWSDYIKGVAYLLKGSGRTIIGMDAVITGDVPIGAGLSSSAALTVAAALAFLTVSGSDMHSNQLAALCQRTEHEFVGVKCGIMDQTICLLGRADYALFLDCRSLQHAHVPLNLGEHVIVICNTKVKRELAASEYNKRRAECEKGVEILRKWLPDIRALRDVRLADFKNYEGKLPLLTQKRCRYVIEENERVQSAVTAVKAGILKTFGTLMNASHTGLRDDYEVSCKELNILTEIARSTDGVIGTRMTGAGFGGCTVTLVHRNAVETLQTRVRTEYRQQTGIEPEVYLCNVSDGATVRWLSE